MYMPEGLKIRKLLLYMITMGFLFSTLGLAQADYIIDPSAYWELEEATATPPYEDQIGTNDGGCSNCPTQNNTDAKVGNGQFFDGVIIRQTQSSIGGPGIVFPSSFG